MRALAWIAIVSALAGCAALPAASVDARARGALDDLVASLEGQGGSISEVNGTMGSNGYSVPFSIEIARDGTRHFNMSASVLTIDVYCGPERLVRIVDGVAYEARGPCPLDGSRATAVTARSLANLTLASIGHDGFLTVANFTGPDPAAGNLSITFDALGRAHHIAYAGPGGALDADASHEPRRASSAPATSARLPAAIDARSSFYAGSYEWRVRGDGDAMPLADLEVRVMNASRGERAATFRGPQNDSKNGFTFVFTDADGDGNVSRRDSFTLTNENWSREGEFSVQVWDAWANAPVGARRMPEISPLIVIATAAACAIISRGAKP